MLFGHCSLMRRQVSKTVFPYNFPGPSEIELNVFGLVDSSIRRGPNSNVFGKFFQLERFRSFFCIELEECRLF